MSHWTHIHIPASALLVHSKILSDLRGFCDELWIAVQSHS
uniref:Uncharacterized protein n=1 Tax=Arundo donax TaxID=35708 RepID=A0A0A9HGX5_ARUDO